MHDELLITEKVAKKAYAYFVNNTPELSDLVLKTGLCTLYENNCDAFESLARSIISQQLSNKASKIIFNRLKQATRGKVLSPKSFLNLNIDTLISAGISNRKAEYLRIIANKMRSGNLDLSSFKNFPNDEVINQLTLLKGVGRWTAEMFLIFCLKRADVLSLADVGIMRAIQNIYNLQKRPDENKMLQMTKKWRPYRSIGCWYLWRMLD